MDINGTVIPAGRARVVAIASGCFLLAAVFAAWAWHVLGPALAGHGLGDARGLLLLPAIAGLVGLGGFVLRAGLASMPDITVSDTKIAVGERWAKWTSLGAFVFNPHTRLIVAQVVGRDADADTLALRAFQFGGRFSMKPDRALVALCNELNEKRGRAYGWAGRPVDPPPVAPAPAPRGVAPPSAEVAGPSPGRSFFGNALTIFAANTLALSLGAAVAVGLSAAGLVALDKAMLTCVVVAAMAAALFLTGHRAGRDRLALVVGSLVYVVVANQLLSLAHAAAIRWTGPTLSTVVTVPFVIWMAMQRIRTWNKRKRPGLKFG